VLVNAVSFHSTFHWDILLHRHIYKYDQEKFLKPTYTLQKDPESGGEKQDVKKKSIASILSACVNNFLSTDRRRTVIISCLHTSRTFCDAWRKDGGWAKRLANAVWRMALAKCFIFCFVFLGIGRNLKM
jgi:hypothetical protein